MCGGRSGIGTVGVWRHTGWRTKCHTIDCARNTFLLLQKHLTSGTELILILTYLLTYLLTPWSRVLLEKLTGSAASQEVPRIFGTRRFLTVLTSARHLSLS